MSLSALDAWSTPGAAIPTAPRRATPTPAARIAANIAASNANRAATPKGPILLSTLAKSPAPVQSAPVTPATPAAPMSAAFIQMFPAEYGWLVDHAATGNTFARSLLKAVNRFGGLTHRQLEAVQKALKTPAPVAPVVAAPVAPVAAPSTAPDAFTLSPAPIAGNWPVLFTDGNGHSVADTGGRVVCIAKDGLPVKFARFCTGDSPVTVDICESVWADFAELSRADFIARHLGA